MQGVGPRAEHTAPTRRMARAAAWHGGHGNARKWHADHTQRPDHCQPAPTNCCSTDQLPDQLSTANPRNHPPYQVEHGLAAEELADGGAQHLAAVGLPAVRRLAGALELQLPALAARVDHLRCVCKTTHSSLVLAHVCTCALAHALTSGNGREAAGPRALGGEVGRQAYSPQSVHVQGAATTPVCPCHAQ